MKNGKSVGVCLKTTEMVCKIADNILSPLGSTTAENLRAVVENRTALRTYDGLWGVKEAFCAALFSEEQNRAMATDGLTDFEQLVYASVTEALSQTDIDVSDSRTLFILSTTKDNINKCVACWEQGVESEYDNGVRRLARRIGFTTTPVVVCNACISGVSAIILAARLLETRQYDRAVVCGAERQGRFIVSGFRSLQALSSAPCRPFDMERCGMNTGEAAATIILSRAENERVVPPDVWRISVGTVRNDAEQLVAPSKTAEGAWRALSDVVRQTGENGAAFINAHGTATLFNDQMEAVAIGRSGLSPIPVNAYKSYYGHTMGAAGVLETVLSMAAADQGIILGTRGLDEPGVKGNLALVKETKSARCDRFIKMISGFGGCNAALNVVRGRIEQEGATALRQRQDAKPKTAHTILICPSGVTVDGTVRSTSFDVRSSAFRGYPRFYKMDALSRLGFLATEMLLEADGEERFRECEDHAIVLFNRTASRVADRRFFDSISGGVEGAASPSAFVRTLPNIVCGEIALRNHWHGETNFVVLPEKDERLMMQIVQATFADTALKTMIAGWLEYEDEQHFEADLKLIRV